jgi:L-amino acid N-acyltransferase YncA
MSGIRPAQAADMTRVAPLLSQAFGYTTETRATDLAKSLTRAFVEHPWADPDVPSLVYEASDGQIVGFIGSMTRRMTHDGTAIRLTCSSSLVVEPDARMGVGALLLKRMLDGPQDLTLTDSARDATELLWRRLGGFAVPVGCMAWARPLRPAGLAWSLLQHRLGLHGSRWSRTPLRSALAPLRALRAGRSELESEPLEVEAVLDLLPKVIDGARVAPAYDEPFLRWIFDELSDVASRGRNVRRLVRSPDGVPLGWYVYYHHPIDICQVVQIMANEADLPLVLGHLFDDAQRAGAVAVYGRVDERLIRAAAFDNRTVVFPYTRLLVHARDEDLAVAVRAGDAILTGLEGDTWLHR